MTTKDNRRRNGILRTICFALFEAPLIFEGFYLAHNFNRINVFWFTKKVEALQKKLGLINVFKYFKIITHSQSVQIDLWEEELRAGRRYQAVLVSLTAAEDFLSTARVVGATADLNLEAK